MAAFTANITDIGTSAAANNACSFAEPMPASPSSVIINAVIGCPRSSNEPGTATELPANISTASVSPKERANPSATAANIPGAAYRTRTPNVIQTRFTPSASAASFTSPGTAPSTSAEVDATNGKTITAKINPAASRDSPVAISNVFSNHGTNVT